MTGTYGSSDFAGLAVGAASVQTQNTAFGNPDSVGVSALNNGSTSFVVVNGSASAVTADQFKGGVVKVNQVSTGPTSYQVVGNTAAAEGGNITLLLSEPLVNEVALIPGTDTVSLYPASFVNLGTPGTTGPVVGLLPIVAKATSDNTSGNPYGVWLLTRGEGTATVSGVVTEGDALTLSSSVDGNLEVAAAGDPIYGVALETTSAAGQCQVQFAIG
jgi:hypothetical protein